MLTILAVSDSIGETANQVAVAAASQFTEKVDVKRIPYVKTLEDIEDVMKIVDECENVIIVSTIITVNVREHLNTKGNGKEYISYECIRTNNKCSINNIKNTSYI